MTTINKCQRCDKKFDDVYLVPNDKDGYDVCCTNCYEEENKK